jgi:methionine-rich copper-binding protein CopC
MNTTTTTNEPKRLIAILRSSQAVLIGLALSVVVLAGLAFDASPAQAHAKFDFAVPAEGTVLAESPDTVEIFFTQDVRRAGGLPTAIVVNESGDDVSLETTLDDDNRRRVVIDMPPALPDGRYTVIWRALSDDDGHDGQGAFHFFVGEPTGDTPAPTETPVDGTSDPTSTPEPTATPKPTLNDGDDSNDSDGVPVWGLIVGIAAAALIAGVAGARIGRMGTR